MFYRTAGISYYTRRLAQALAALPECNQAFTLSMLLDRRDADTAWLPANVNAIRTVTPAHHKLESVALAIELAISNLKSPISLLHSPDFITCAGAFKKVITVHDLYFMEHPEVMSADGARYYGRIRWSAQQADRIIAVSHFTRQDIQRLMPEVDSNKITVVHEAADDFRSFDNQRDEKPISQFPIRNSQFILFVGTLEPRKNLITLLKALQRLPDEVRLTIAGADGWGESNAKQIATGMNMLHRVTFAGRVSDAELDALYRHARLLAMPSLHEGFGLPVLEAMARGTPTVCSNAGSLPEIAGDAALLHDPQDDAMLAKHIHALWFVDALHDEHRRRSIERAAQFSWQRAASETLEVYRMALNVH
jgi:glycosyltransferase involved in cell wall biosynthesis